MITYERTGDPHHYTGAVCDTQGCNCTLSWHYPSPTRDEAVSRLMKAGWFTSADGKSYICPECVRIGGIPPRIQIQIFSKHMEALLRENDHKGGWEGSTYGYFLDHIEVHLIKLRQALERRDTHDIVHEAADLANYAMMIADNVKNRRPGGMTHAKDGTPGDPWSDVGDEKQVKGGGIVHIGCAPNGGWGCGQHVLDEATLLLRSGDTRKSHPAKLSVTGSCLIKAEHYEIAQIVQVRADGIAHAESADGKYRYYLRRDATSRRWGCVLRRDMESGEEVEVRG